MRFWYQILVLFIVSLIPSLIVIGLVKASPSGLIVLWPLFFLVTLGKCLDEIIVKVEPLRAKIIKDMTTGNMRVVGPGWHTKYFWPEKIHKEISLEEIKLVVKEDKYETADSPVMISGLLVYRPDIEFLLFFIQRDKNDLEEILNSLLRNAVGEILSEKKSDDAVKQRPEIGHKILELFKQRVEFYQKRTDNYQQEDMLGILVSNFIINNIKIDPELQQAKTQEDIERRQKKSERIEQEAFAEQIEFYMKKFGWSAKEAADYVMQARGRGTKRIIIDMQGDESGEKPHLDLKLEEE